MTRCAGSSGKSQALPANTERGAEAGLRNDPGDEGSKLLLALAGRQGQPTPMPCVAWTRCSSPSAGDYKDVTMVERRRTAGEVQQAEQDEAVPDGIRARASASPSAGRSPTSCCLTGASAAVTTWSAASAS